VGTQEPAAVAPDERAIAEAAKEAECIGPGHVSPFQGASTPSFSRTHPYSITS
jgi:hypothetical protein